MNCDANSDASKPVAPPKAMTVQDAAREIEEALCRAGIDEARTVAEWLVAETVGIGRLDLLLSGDRAVSDEERARIIARAGRVAAGEPLQYVLGYTPFMGRDFLCDPRALIPRPETEELCEMVLATLPRDSAARTADVGTGTGCIAVTLALDRPRLRVRAIDLSPEALALARENARRLGVDGRIEWACADLLSEEPDASYDLIVSNPPYVSEHEWERLDRSVRQYEPRVALVGGADGLEVIRRLSAQARRVLAPGGMLWLEIGNEQGPEVHALLESLGFTEVAVLRDLAGHWRIARARRPHV